MIAASEKRGFVPNDVQKVTVHWAFHFLSNRVAFAFFGQVYTWKERYKHSRQADLWEGARSELYSASYAAPLIYCEVDSEVYPKVPAVDASTRGFGICVSTPPLSVIWEAMRLAGQKGWFVEMGVLDERDKGEHEWHLEEVSGEEEDTGGDEEKTSFSKEERTEGRGLRGHPGESQPAEGFRQGYGQEGKAGGHQRAGATR